MLAYTGPVLRDVACCTQRNRGGEAVVDCHPGLNKGASHDSICDSRNVDMFEALTILISGVSKAWLGAHLARNRRQGFIVGVASPWY